MTKPEKDNAQYQFNKFQSAREKHWARIIAKAINQQVQQAASEVRQGNTSPIISSQPILDALQPLYIDVATIYGHKILVGIKRDQKARLPMGFSARMYMLILQYYGLDFLNLSEDISQTTRDHIQQVLTNAYAPGLSIDEIVKKITDKDLTRMRARLIARTETVAAANAGGLIVAKDTGLDLNKIWISGKDNRTRRSHIIADEQKVDIDGFFTIGGYKMKVPGDKGGKEGMPRVPGSLIINCRCAAVYEKAGR